MRNLVGSIIGALLFAAALAASQARPQDIRLQAAIRLETVDGNLTMAIAEFTALAREFEKTDRRVSALAMLHLADCYRKQGEAKARGVYEEVTVKFRDQPDVAAMARSRLDTWNSEAPATHWAWTEPPDGSLASGVSSDGRLLAFVDWSDAGNGDLFVQTLGTRAPRRVVPSLKDASGKAIGGADEAAFSRDGRQLAYTWFEKDKTELRVVPLGTPASVRPRTLFVDPDVCCITVHDWSPDGRLVAVVLQTLDRTARIALISTVDGTVRTLKPLAWQRPARMAFSPEGQWLAYDLQGPQTNAREIYAAAVADGRETPLVIYKGNDELVGWAPDGSLVFTSDRTSTLGLWISPVTNGQAGTARLLRGDLGRFAPVGITSAGAIYYCRCEPARGSDIRMGTFDFSTGTFVGPLVDAVQEFVGTNSQPFWAPDGKSFVYRSLRENQDPVLAIRSADLSHVRELRPKMKDLIDPRWSPDGKSLAVLGRDFEGRYGFHLIEVATAGVTPIALTLPGETFQAMEDRFAWSADGTKIYFRRRSKTDYSFIEWDLASADERVLLHLKEPVVRNAFLMTDGAVIYMNPVAPGRTRPSMTRREASGAGRELASATALQGLSPSPDGRFVATTAGDVADAHTRVVVIPIEGGPMREVWTVSDGSVLGKGTSVNALNAWAPDSQSIVVAKVLPDDKGVEYWWVPIDGRSPHRLVELQGLSLGAARIRVHPDGRRIVFGAKEAPIGPVPPMELWVLEDVLPRVTIKR